MFVHHSFINILLKSVDADSFLVLVFKNVNVFKMEQKNLSLTEMQLFN